MDKNKNEEMMSRVWRSLNCHQDLEKRMVMLLKEPGKREFEYFHVLPNKKGPSTELRKYVLKKFGIDPFK